MIGLEKRLFDQDPYQQFETWYQLALAKIPLANAMTLATVDADGMPSARIVLLKDHDQAGFVFYTNYQSSKGQALAENPQAALVFWWRELDRQVRIEGMVNKVSAQESDAYFHSRSRDSQFGAIASNQSQPLASRAELIERVDQLEDQWQAKEKIDRPADWGGYRLVTNKYEFWQAGEHRLHDRIVYLREAQHWRMLRLAP